MQIKLISGIVVLAAILAGSSSINAEPVEIRTEQPSVDSERSETVRERFAVTDEPDEIVEDRFTITIVSNGSEIQAFSNDPNVELAGPFTENAPECMAGSDCPLSMVFFRAPRQRCQPGTRAAVAVAIGFGRAGNRARGRASCRNTTVAGPLTLTDPGGLLMSADVATGTEARGPAVCASGYVGRRPRSFWTVVCSF